MKIAIWGMGVSGLSALKYLSTTGHELYAINLGTAKTWKNFTKISKYISLDHMINQANLTDSHIFDQIILSPGIDRKSPTVKKYIDAGVEVINEIELAFRTCKLPIIAITGTNGKTTTTTMMTQAFEKAGKRVYCGGNIGYGFCDMISDQENYDLVILELSSFQLESLKDFHAKISVILNITPSHMERYDGFEDYKNAKLNISINQNNDDLFISPKKFKCGDARFIELEKLKSFDFSSSNLVGDHQKENLFCVYESLKFFNIIEAQKVTQEIISHFNGVKYRQQFEAQKEGATFINDAKSTNIDATLSAVEAYKEEEITLILGGQLRSPDISFIDEIKLLNLKRVYCFGESRNLVFGKNYQVVHLKFVRLKS